MKFTSFLVLGLGAFVASCSAACECKASDQACLESCVKTANACIVACETKGEACQESCIMNNWPAMPAVQKDVLAEATDSPAKGSAAPTGGATPSTGAGASPTGSMMTASMSGANSMGMSASSGSFKPSATGSMSGSLGSGMAKPTSGSGTKMENANPSSDASSSKAIFGWSVAMIALVGSTAWML